MNDTVTTVHPIQTGAKARVTKDTLDLSDQRPRPAGFEFVVEDYVPADVAEDGVAFYWGSSGGGCNNVTVAADVVELAMTAEAMRDRQLPSAGAVLQAMSGPLSGLDAEEFTTDGTELDGPQQLLICGQTREGLRFAARVAVLAVEHADF